jgi:hypothetical protein
VITQLQLINIIIIIIIKYPIEVQDPSVIYLLIVQVYFVTLTVS